MSRSLLRIACLLLVLSAAPTHAQDDSGSGRDADRTRTEDRRDVLDDRDLRDTVDLPVADDRSDGDHSGSSRSGSDSLSSGSDGSNSGSSSSDSSGSGSGSDDSHSGSGSSGSSPGSGSSDDDSDDAVKVEDDVTATASNYGLPAAIETDMEGRERISGELLVMGSTTQLGTLRANGFEVVNAYATPGQSLTLILLRVRNGSDETADMALLRSLLASQLVEPHFAYRLADANGGTKASGAPPPAQTSAREGALVGMVDTGVDLHQPELHGRVAGVYGFGGRHVARAHGTRVAQILARHGVRVRVADVFQMDEAGEPVATAASIARGLDWFATQHVPVINISLSGPYSKVLAEVVARVQRQGTIVVAAAGNDGPSAPPVYPAALPGVLGVTAIDARDRVYRRANRGELVDFAAFGVDVPVANGTGSEQVTGTSFASPVVSATLARQLLRERRTPDSLLSDLQKQARDLGKRGRDPVFGWGAIDPPGEHTP